MAFKDWKNTKMKIIEVIRYEVDDKSFATQEEAESHLALKQFEISINNLKDKILECEFISPHFRVAHHAFSSDQLDDSLEVAKDIVSLVNKIRAYRGGE
jgi:hypothetical protein